MIVEWECTLNCNYRCLYCTNGRNSVLEKPIKEVTNLNKLSDFISTLKTRFPNEELFLFGGEPLLHRKINDIIEMLNSVKMKFVIQTNFSLIDRLKTKDPYTVQISIHPDFVNLNTCIDNIKKYYDRIRNIDIMYTGKEVLTLYKNMIKVIPKDKIHIAPLADFKTNKKLYRYKLYEFNKFKEIFKDLPFESGQRSYIWEKMMKNQFTTKGKRCLYNDKYFLFTPDLQEYNCSHRIKCEICPNDACFLM